MHRGLAQSDVPSFSQQMFSSINFNPAAVPVEKQIQASLFGRHQWMGFKDAPRSVMLNLQGYVDEIKSGIGATVVGDVFGKSYLLNAKLSYSYHFSLGKSNYLSLGLGAGVIYRNFRGSDIILDQNGDPAINEEDVNDVKPDVDFGLAFTSGKFSVGLSSTHLTAFAYDKDDLFSPKMGLHLFATYYGYIGDKVMLQPYLKASYYDLSTFALEVDFRAEFFKTFWVGAGYRYKDVVKVMAGVTIAKIVSIGYCYDLNVGKIKKYSSGSHEIMLSLRFATASKIGKVTETPRHFGEGDQNRE